MGESKGREVRGRLSRGVREGPPEQSWGTREPEGRGVREQACTGLRQPLVSVSS